MKTLSILSATIATVVLGVSAMPAVAQEQALPAAYLVHKLSADGLQLRSIEAEDGVFEARVVATDGQLVKVGVDPHTAFLTDDFSHARPGRPEKVAPRVGAVEAMVAAAETGFWDLREMDYEHGRWEVKAADDQGRVREIHVNGTTGKVE